VSKVQTLADQSGYDSPEDMFEEVAFDSVHPGICTNAGCDYTTDVEPDCKGGWCACCEEQTVASIGVLMGII
jgi:hypothetical protein